MKKIDRRKFIQQSTLSSAAVASGAVFSNCSSTKTLAESSGTYMGDFAAPKIEKVRAAFIGVGNRGGDHLSFLASLEGTEVVGICDLYEDNVKKWKSKAEDIGGENRHQNVKVYFGGEDEWRKMLTELNPDVVFIATNWNTHAVMAIESMKTERMPSLKFQLQ